MTVVEQAQNCHVTHWPGLFGMDGYHNVLFPVGTYVLFLAAYHCVCYPLFVIDYNFVGLI